MESEKEREHEPQIKNKQTPKSNYTSHKKICMSLSEIII